MTGPNFVVSFSSEHRQSISKTDVGSQSTWPSAGADNQQPHHDLSLTTISTRRLIPVSTTSGSRSVSLLSTSRCRHPSRLLRISPITQQLPSIMDPDAPLPEPQPSALRWVLGFICVGIAWGFTTPFIRRGAVNFKPSEHPSVDDPERSWVYRKVAKAVFTVVDLLRSPGYAVPLVLNMTGSIWFFILVGSAGTS